MFEDPVYNFLVGHEKLSNITTVFPTLFLELKVIHFLVFAFIIKERGYYNHFFVFLRDESFVQFVQINKYLENASKIVQRALFIFPFFELTYKAG